MTTDDIQARSDAFAKSLMNICSHGVEVKILGPNGSRTLDPSEYTVDPVTGTVTFKDALTTKTDQVVSVTHRYGHPKSPRKVAQWKSEQRRYHK